MRWKQSSTCNCPSCSRRTLALEAQGRVIQELVDDLFEKMASGTAAWLCVLASGCFSGHHGVLGEAYAAVGEIKP